MKTNTKSQRPVWQSEAWFSKSIPGSGEISLALALVAAGLLLAVPSSMAQTNLSTADMNFIAAAAQGGMTEVKLGELASQKGSRPDVKSFGQMMVKDHSAINDDLKSLAKEKGVTIPDNLDAKHQDMVDKMSALNGAEFDNAFIAGMAKAHTKDAKAFKGESATTKDADIKSFVDKSLPVVEEHLKDIKMMKK